MSSGLKNLLDEAPKYSWVEVGTAVFSFFNIIIISISACVSIGFLSSLTLSYYLQPQYEDRVLWHMCFVACAVISLSFAFSILLYFGMYQRRPSFVLTYFIFGVVVDLSVVALLVLYKNYKHTWKSVSVFRYIESDVNSGHTMIAGVCVVYTFILFMVFRTYVLMAKRSHHQRLINECDRGDRSRPISIIYSHKFPIGLEKASPEYHFKF